MKKISTLLMLIISISVTAIAQHEPNKTKSDQTFEMNSGDFKRKFIVDLDKGNKMQVEFNEMTDLDRFKNLDSVLRVFLQDITPLKDSLSDELSSKRIDYLTDSEGRKKIRIQLFQPKGSSFLVQEGEAAVLKLEQDTVNFMGTVSYMAKVAFRKPFQITHNYRLSFFVNQLSDLNNYLDGRLNEKITTIRKNIQPSLWTKAKDGRWIAHNSDNSIYVKHPAGYTAPRGDFLTLQISVNAQNYKNYFVPSFSLGAGLIFSNGFFKRDIRLSWEPNFFFGKNTQDNLQTYRNDFLTLSLAHGFIRDNDPRKESHFLAVLSFGYLINRKGNFFEKNTMRLGAGNISIFEGKTKIEPALYFTDLFKRVTPGIRWVQNF